MACYDYCPEPTHGHCATCAKPFCAAHLFVGGPDGLPPRCEPCFDAGLAPSIAGAVAGINFREGVSDQGVVPVAQP